MPPPKATASRSQQNTNLCYSFSWYIKQTVWGEDVRCVYETKHLCGGGEGWKSLLLRVNSHVLALEVVE